MYGQTISIAYFFIFENDAALFYHQNEAFVCPSETWSCEQASESFGTQVPC